MIDLLITFAIFLALLCCVIYKAKISPEVNPLFFDLQSTNALRGIWSIIVILVHIPKEYGNVLQDIAGSFAYIGVTFFFLVSGYGLSLGVLRNGSVQKKFWQKRLPKLLIPQLLINASSALLFWAIFGDKIQFSSFTWIARWLRWLLVCYFIFWLTHKLCKNIKWANGIIYVCVMIFSISQYFLKRFGVITESIWPTEVFGFIWGILLSVFFVYVKNQGKVRWLLKTAVVCIAALILGLLYLNFKTIAFWGDYLLKIILGFTIIAFILFLNMKISFGNKALDFLGKISYELYLSHTIVINIVERAMENVSSGEFILIVLTLSMVMAVIIHFISAFVLKKLSSIPIKNL